MAGWGAVGFTPTGHRSKTSSRRSVAIMGVRQDEELHLAQRDLDALLDLSESLIRTHEIEGTLFQICVRLSEVMQADRCSIILLDDEAKRGFVIAASDDGSLKEHRIDVEQYPEIGEVVRTGAPLVIDDVDRAPLFDTVREKIRNKRVASSALFPVRIDRRVQGVLLVRGSKTRANGLASRTLRFGRIVANATAIAIRNARLYDLIRDRSERRLSERLRAERRLRQIEKYQRFFDFAGDGLIIVDGGARILLANRAARAILGFDAAALSKVTLHDLIDVKGKEALDALMSGVRSGLYQSFRDLPVVRASGEVAILSLTTAALSETATGDLPAIADSQEPPREDPAKAAAGPSQDQTGIQQDVAAIISFRDVTATRKMQEELRTTKDFLLNLIESSADAIVAADMKGRILVFNKVAERITGYKSVQVIGSSVAMLYPPGVAREIMADLRSDSYGGAGRLRDRRQSLLTRTGELVPISLAASIVYDEGREVATLGIFSDLRERLWIEQTLQKAQRQLELSERQAAVVELAGAAAHELNQPLTSILGSAELMARRLDEQSPTSASVRTILSEAERMAEIVRKLGQITKYETKPYLGITNILDLDAASKEEE